MQIVTTNWVASELQTSADTVKRLIRSGDLKAERLTPRGRYRVIKQSVIDYANKHGIVLKSSQSQPQ